jgi:hypothetical protein
MRGRTHACTGGYACGGDACATACTNDDECDAAHYCVGGACRARHDDGTTCGNNSECTSTFCADEHCCTVPLCALGTYCGGPGGTCINQMFPGDPTPCSAGYQCTTGKCQGVCH